MMGPGYAAMIGVMVFFAFITLLIVVGIAAIVAVQASYRGYNVFVWLIAACLGNPVFLLILLGVLPDRARRGLRESELDDLDRRRRQVPRRLPPATVEPVRPRTTDVQRSLGDAETRLPIDRSLGDMETRLPIDRSVGDEETRG